MRQTIALLAGGALLLAAAAPAEDAKDQAAAILKAAGVTGGLVVHVGGGAAPALTAALRANEGLIVQGLDTDPAVVSKVRTVLREAGVYGPVSADVWDGRHLPYVDNLVRLLVVSGDSVQVPGEEIQRVLCPGGAAVRLPPDTRNLTPDTFLRKPWPADIDEWTHWQRDAGRNAVARDERVGPPRRLQWVARPLYSRGHEVPSSVGAAVTARGRLFCVLDKGATGLYEMPSRWTLVARDAFSGAPLWERPVPEWGPEFGKGGFGSAFNARRLATDGDRLYLPDGPRGHLTAISAETGEVVQRWEEAAGADEVSVDGGILMATVAAPEGNGRALWAARTGSREPAWRQTPANLVRWTLAVHGGRAFFQDGTDLAAVEAATGQPLWRQPLGDLAAAPQTKLPRGGPILSLIAVDGALVVSGAKQVLVLDPATGQERWRREGGGREVFVVGDTIWNGMASLDLATGEPRRSLNPASVFNMGHHPRCYPGKATTRYIIANNRGAEFIGLDGEELAANDWLRGNCAHGVLPANGLLYVPPNQCFCYGGAMLIGFKALAAADDAAAALPEPSARLERGPAFDDAPPPAAATPPAGDWPMYRGGPERFGGSAASVGAVLRPAWQAAVGGRLTPPVAAGGLIFVARQDTHTLHAFAAADGTPRWQFTAGGRIDSPPTICGDRVLFGDTGGRVYALRARDGALAWRFLAAPADRRMGAFDGIESVWPVSGSVLVWRGSAYVVAGRSTWLDGGLRAWALDPRTGAVRHAARLEGGAGGGTPPPPTGKDPYVPAFHTEGARNDLLVTDGEFLYLGPLKLNERLERQPTPYVKPGPEPVVALDLKGAPYVDAETFEKPRRNDWPDVYGAEVGRGPLGDKAMGGRRVFATGGFLDDALFNRTFWMYAAIWPGYYKANFSAKAGQLVAVDAERTYGARLYHRGYGHSPTFVPGKGCLLFADANDNEPALDDRARGKDKGFGYSRLAPPLWHRWIPLHVRALVAADENLFVAGPPDEMPAGDPYAALEGRRGARLLAFDKRTGEPRGELALESPPVFDGLMAAPGRLYASLADGRLVCVEGSK